MAAQRKVIIAGASSGIGRALALHFAEHGFLVGAVARRLTLLESLHELYPNSIFVAQADLTAPDAIETIDRLTERLGGMDIFIFSAGTISISAKPNWDLDEQVIDLNINAFTRIVGHVYNDFLEKKIGGQIVVLSSIAAVRGGSSAPVYNASKAFQSIYSESLNLQAVHSGNNIIISDIQLGYVATEMGKGAGAIWVMPVQKAARQIFRKVVLRKNGRAVISKRWIPVVWMLRNIPQSLLALLTRDAFRKNKNVNAS